MSVPASLRSRVGCWLNERWRTELAIRGLGAVRWQDLCNRHETLEAGDDARSRRCAWKETSHLTVSRVFPGVGGRLLAACARSDPPALAAQPAFAGAQPCLTVVIATSGADRRAQLEVVLRSFAAQSAGDVEVVLVESSAEPTLADLAALGARHVHLERSKDVPFNKSRAFNVGVQAATTELILLHDGDIVVPRGYVAALLERFERGFDAIRPVRLLFYATRTQTETILAARSGEMVSALALDEVEIVAQNIQGGSTAVRREVYRELGGHDEAFAGWGGEDTEFLDRLGTRRLFRGAYDYGVHLWHPPAVGKAPGEGNVGLLAEKLAVPAIERIARLRSP